MRPSWGNATSGPKAVSGIFTEGAIEFWAVSATLVFSLPLLNQKFPKGRLRWFQKPKIGSAVRADMDLEVGAVESSQKFATPKISDPIASLVFEIWTILGKWLPGTHLFSRTASLISPVRRGTSLGD